MDAIQLHLNIAPGITVPKVDGTVAEQLQQIESQRNTNNKQRRQFRGDRQDLLLDVALLNTWQAGFRNASSVGGRPAICAEVVRKYEGRVNEYGYSLVDLSRVVVTARIRPFMLPGFEQQPLPE